VKLYIPDARNRRLQTSFFPCVVSATGHLPRADRRCSGTDGAVAATKRCGRRAREAAWAMPDGKPLILLRAGAARAPRPQKHTPSARRPTPPRGRSLNYWLPVPVSMATDRQSDWRAGAPVA